MRYINYKSFEQGACISFVNEFHLDHVEPEKIKESFQKIKGTKDSQDASKEEVESPKTQAVCLGRRSRGWLGELAC